MNVSPPPIDFSGWPFNAAVEDPPTTMVPPRRPGVFAVILVDGCEATLRIFRKTTDGSYHPLRQERDRFHAAGQPQPDARHIAVMLVDILIRYQRISELHGASVRAIATHSFRSFPNHPQLLQRLPRVTRVALQLISEREAARYLCWGALNGRSPGQQTLVIDMGEEATSVVLAKVPEPLALWRLELGTSRLPELSAGHMAAQGDAAQVDGQIMRNWQRRVRQVLSLGHLDAIRGVADEAILVRRRGSAPNAPEHLIAVTTLNEISAHLHVRRMQSTESGLCEGVLLELSGTPPAMTPSALAVARQPGVPRHRS